MSVTNLQSINVVILQLTLKKNNFLTFLKTGQGHQNWYKTEQLCSVELIIKQRLKYLFLIATMKNFKVWASATKKTNCINTNHHIVMIFHSVQGAHSNHPTTTFTRTPNEDTFLPKCLKQTNTCKPTM